jgi:pimeloyl-ACP methyl ester carboxylesterase
MTQVSLLRMIAAAGMAVVLGGCGGDDAPDAVTAEVVATRSVSTPTVAGAQARLITHTMPSRLGGSTRATTLLFVPAGPVPSGGWPVVAWVHGTTTVAHKSCAPSQTLDTLDGGLTAEGFTSRYDEVVSSFLGAGYAVVAPDFEGLGDASDQPFAYYDSASESRSIIAAVVAARSADASLSNRWLAVGHSEGGRGVLVLQRYLDEARGLDFRGTVALAPFANIAASVERFDALRASDPANAGLYAGIQNFFVGMFATAVQASGGPALDQSALMGADLQALLPRYQQQCVFSTFGSVAGAVAAKGDSFDGWRAGWAVVPAVKAFLERNDPGAMPDFAITQPTLVVQGTADIFVLEPLTTALFDAHLAKGAPLSYKVYPGSDHGSIVIDAAADMLAFIGTRMAP